MKQLIEHMAQALVDEPEQVMVTEAPDGEILAFKLEVAQDDLGRIIGRRGRTAAAMRSLLSASASKSGDRATLEIVG
jgi:hypothetical protein